MLLWTLALLALISIWLGGLVLAVFEIDVPLIAQLVATGLVGLTVVGVLVFRRIRAERRAKALEAAILKQSEQQASAARPDRRAEIQDLQRRFQQGVSGLRSTKIGKAHGRNALYALPWYAIIGPPGAGKTTALKHSGLVFPVQDQAGSAVRGVGGTRNCDWWFTNEGILLDTAGRYATDDSDREEWTAFLGLLRRFRPEKPINGLLIAISVADLFDAKEDQIIQYAGKLRARVDEIMTQLEMVLPVYLIFTKCDLIGGFVEFWGDLKKSDRDHVLGATFPLEGAETLDPGPSFGVEFDKIAHTVSARALTVIGKENQLDSRAKIFQFPLEFRALKGNLELFSSQLFQRNAFQESPIFRGFYFTSGTQEGKPFERVTANLAQALGIRIPPALRPATESKSYFVTDLFRKIVFPDQGVAARTAAELRRQKLVRALIAAAAGVVGSLIVFPALASFFKNRTLITTTEEVARGASQVKWAVRGDTPAKVAALDKPLERLRMLNQYSEEGAPLSYRWGLYEGDALYPPLRDSYVRQLSAAMAAPVQKKVEFDLEAIGMASGVQISQYGKMYDRVKLYVMMTEPAHLDPGWAVPHLVQLWSQVLESENTETKDAMLKHVEEYVRLVKNGEVPPWVARDKARDRARSVLLRAPSIERTYDMLVREASEHVAAVTRETIFYGSSAPFVASVSGRKVDGAYTAEGWALVKKLLTTESTRLEGEKWVLGEEGSPAQDVESQVKKLRKLYFDRYIEDWRAFLADLEVSRPKESTTALEELSALSEPEWPYMRLLRILHENTALPVDDGESRFVEAVKGKLERTAEKMVSKLEGRPAEKKAPAPTGPQYVPELKVFRPLTSFAVAEGTADPASTGLAQYQALLAKLIGVMTDLRDSDTPSKTGPLEQEFENAFRAASTLLATQDGFTRPLLSPFLLRPITGAWTGVSNDVGSAAGGLWEAMVWDVWRTKLEPNFPIRATSPTDAKLEDFIEFFRPETGTLWSFYKDNLSGQIRREGNTFIPNRRFDSRVEFDGAFLSNCLSRGAAITDAFFHGGTDPKFEFQVSLHSVSKNVSDVYLEVDGVERVYRNTPEEWLTTEWPAKEGTPGARVRIRGSDSLDEQIVRDGEFGFLRLLAAASSLKPGTAGGRPGAAPTLVATYEFRSVRASLALDIRSRQGLDALSPDLFRDYTCAKVIKAASN